MSGDVVSDPTSRVTPVGNDRGEPMRIRTAAILAAAVLLATGCSTASDTTDGATGAPAVASSSSTTEARDTEEAKPRRVQIPDVVGMEVVEAQSQLEDEGFLVRVEGDDDLNVAKQRPSANITVTEGATVVLETVDPSPTADPAHAAGMEELGVMVLFTQMIENDGREPVIAVVETIADSVDNLAFDIETRTVDLAVTSGWSGTDNQIEAGWDIARALKQLWEEREDAQYVDEIEWPSLELDVDGHRFSCPGDAMRAVATSRTSRSQWEASCGR